MSHTADQRRRQILGDQRAARCPGSGRAYVETDDIDACRPRTGRATGFTGPFTCPDCGRSLRATATPDRYPVSNLVGVDGQTLWNTTYRGTIPHHRPAERT